MFWVIILSLGLTVASELTIVKKYYSVYGEMAQLDIFYETVLASKQKTSTSSCMIKFHWKVDSVTL